MWFLINTLLLYPSLSPYYQTDGRTDGLTEERIYPGWAGHPDGLLQVNLGWAGHPGGFLQVNPGWAGHPDGFLQVNPGCAGRTMTGSSRLILVVLAAP